MNHRFSNMTMKPSARECKESVKMSTNQKKAQMAVLIEKHDSDDSQGIIHKEYML